MNNSGSQRKTSLNRRTGETDVSLTVNLDGRGDHQISTGNGMLDHLLRQLSRHGLIDLKLSAKGDLETGWHHLVEDIAITLGRAFHQALGEGSGIRRMAHALVPLDEALALVAVDLSGRGYARLDLDLAGEMVETLPGDMVHHFLETLAVEGKFNLHVRVMCGQNSHHKAEAIFKALAKALRSAMEEDLRGAGQIPSTKGTIQG